MITLFIIIRYWYHRLSKGLGHRKCASNLQATNFGRKHGKIQSKQKSCRLQDAFEND